MPGNRDLVNPMALNASSLFWQYNATSEKRGEIPFIAAVTVTAHELTANNKSIGEYNQHNCHNRHPRPFPFLAPASLDKEYFRVL